MSIRHLSCKATLGSCIPASPAWGEADCVNAPSNAQGLCRVGHRAGARDKHGDAPCSGSPEPSNLSLATAPDRTKAAWFSSAPGKSGSFCSSALLCAGHPGSDLALRQEIVSAVWALAAASAGTITFPIARMTLSSNKCQGDGRPQQCRRRWAA